MGKAVALLCVLAAVATLAHAHKEGGLRVEGEVYCDPCRVKFNTELSQQLPGATVRLECKKIDTKSLTYSAEAVAGPDGRYNLTVTGDHEDDICEVFAVKSPREDCKETMNEFERARVVCTENDGIHDEVRYANPVGFMTQKTLPQCRPVLYNLGILYEE